MEHDDIKHKAMKAMRNDTGCKREEWNCRNHREGGGIAAMVLNAWKGHLLTRRQREQLYVLEPRCFAGHEQLQVFLHSTILSHLVILYLKRFQISFTQGHCVCHVGCLLGTPAASAPYPGAVQLPQVKNGKFEVQVEEKWEEIE